MIVTKARTVGRTARGVVCRPVPSGTPAAKVARTTLSLAMTLMLALPLAGCRASDVLTEKIIGDAGQYDIDYSLSPVAIENPLVSSDISQNEDESDRQDDHDYSESSYDEDQQNANDQVSASQGQNASDSTGSGTAYDGTGEQKNGSTIKFDFTGNADVNDPDPNDPNNPDNSQISTGPTDNWTPTDGDNKGLTTPKTSIITKGNYGNLPETVTSVAAAGANATVVQSIGGKGALAATNQEWLDDLPAAAYDNQSELEGVGGLSSWGDGTMMSTATFQEVTNLLPHDWTAAVLVSNSYAITQEQAEAFSADSDTGRIYVIEVGTMGVADALDADIAETVEMVGVLLGASGGGDGKAQERASTWKTLHTQALEGTMQKNGGLTTYLMIGQTWNYVYQGGLLTTPLGSGISSNRSYTVYIDAWAYPQGGSEIVSGDNASRFFGGTYSWPFGSWYKASESSNLDMSVDISDGVGLSAVDSNKASGSAYLLRSYYLQYSGVVDMQVWAYAIRDEIESGQGLLSYLSLPAGRTSFSAALAGSTALWSYTTSASDNSHTFSLGDDSLYPYLIVRDKAMAQQVVESASKADKASNTVGLYNYGDDYDVLVMPYGIAGSWADGTFESFLMAPYFYGVYQDGSAKYSDNYVDQFYSAFYRCSAKGILDGEGNWGSDSTGGSACGGYGYSVQAICKTE